MIIFPLRTDRRLKSTPWVNYTLIGLNVFVFVMTFGQIAEASVQMTRTGVPATALMPEFPVLRYYLWPGLMQAHQFLTYQFLHADIWHLVGNMLFLYVFGNSVEDRLGSVGYLLFYLAAGVVAAIGHVLIEPNPILGASGSIAGVTGAYLALFPLSNVTIVYWIIFVGYFEVPSMWLILFRVVQDAVFQLWGGSNVAYLAHLAGYGFGFAVGMGMLLVRLLPREPYDMLALLEHRRRRSQYRRMTKRGFQPWEGGASVRTAAHLEQGQTPPKLDEKQQKVMDLRAQISRAAANHDLPEAARLYRQLLERDAAQVLGQQAQLDVANQLMAEGQYDSAAAAYELLLSTYPSYPQRHHVQLILGLIYARYLKQPQRARELLEGAYDHLSASDRELAQQVLSEL